MRPIAKLVKFGQDVRTPAQAVGESLFRCREIAKRLQLPATAYRPSSSRQPWQALFEKLGKENMTRSFPLRGKRIVDAGQPVLEPRCR